MLPKEARLSRIGVERVFREGKPLFVGVLGCRYVRREEDGAGASRFGLIIGKKAISRAVDRNKIRRLLRESLCELKEMWPKGIDIVIFLPKRVPPPSQDSFLRPLSAILKRIAGV